MTSEARIAPQVYEVFLGVFGVSNPGLHAVAMVTRLGDLRYEWARPVGRCTTPQAWITAVSQAIVRVDRPHAHVVIFVRDQQLTRTLAGTPANDHPAFLVVATLLTRPNTAVTWLPKREGHPEMEYAHELARQVLLRKERVA
jgi:hypothetical protein